MCALRAKAWISSVVKMEPIFELLFDASFGLSSIRQIPDIPS